MGVVAGCAEGHSVVPPAGALDLSERAAVTLTDGARIARAAVSPGGDALYWDQRTQSVHRVDFEASTVTEAGTFQDVVGLQDQEGQFLVVTQDDEILIGSTPEGRRLWSRPAPPNILIDWVGVTNDRVVTGGWGVTGEYILLVEGGQPDSWLELFRNPTAADRVWASTGDDGVFLVEVGIPPRLHVIELDGSHSRLTLPDSLFRRTGGDLIDANWIASAAVSLGRGRVILPVVDTRSDHRLWLRVSVEGELERSTELDVSLIPIAASPKARLMLTSRLINRHELVLYAWRWTDEE